MCKQSLQTKYDEIKQRLRGGGIDVSACTSISYGIQFSVSIQEWSGVIRIYQNKKGVIRNDYSQLKNGEHSSKVISIIEQTETGEKKFDVAELRLPVIGTDESGRGDYFGPLVAAGVYVDEKSAKLLNFEGIRDSKELSDRKILSLLRK